MSKLMSLIRRAPKRFSAVVAVIAAAIIVPAASLAWGPDRPTYTINNPADHNTFNSITDNPNIGDERNFVGIREVGSSNVWHDDMNVKSGKEYYVRMYVHNNAADNLNKVAENVTAKVNLPTTTGKSIQVNGFINSTNSSPREVYDHATFKSAENFNLAYVGGSLKYENNFFGPNGKALPESIFTSAGAKLGYNKLDGKIPGCFKYAGYVTFKVKPQFAKTTNFTLQKKVSKHDANQWVDSYKAKPGEKVDFILAYKNTGQVQHNDVTFRDTLPTGLSYVAKSGTWSNASKQNVPFNNDAALTNGTGVNVGSYKPGANAYTIFSAKVASEDKLKCGTNTLVNKGKVNTGGYSVEDTANVTVDKKCEPPVVSYVCKALTVTTVDRTHFRFNTTYAAQNATFKSVTYVIKNAAGQIVETKTSASTALDYTRTTVGKYTVQATVTFTVKGQDKTVTSEGCKGNFEVKEVPPKDIKVCELATKKIITIKENQFDASKHSKNLNDCKEKYLKVCELATKKIITIKESDFDASKHSTDLNKCKETPKDLKVCELATKKIITIKESDFDASKHSKDLNDCKEKYLKVCELSSKTIITIKESDFDASKHSKDLNKCKETPPTKIEVCDYTTKTVVTINEGDFDESKHTEDLSKCEETPVTPPELPQTGAGENIVAIFGLGALIASAGYYIASRRALNQ